MISRRMKNLGLFESAGWLGRLSHLVLDPSGCERLFRQWKWDRWALLVRFGGSVVALNCGHKVPTDDWSRIVDTSRGEKKPMKLSGRF